ncbi:hypothetical protein HD806DRAFT_540082 [Xylariaceae sp. AK1471]|nr:hypothetical protein HD806DRAFT_540082 [Xylariaceae sp. AK1471]
MNDYEFAAAGGGGINYNHEMEARSRRAARTMKISSVAFSWLIRRRNEMRAYAWEAQFISPQICRYVCGTPCTDYRDREFLTIIEDWLRPLRILSLREKEDACMANASPYIFRHLDHLIMRCYDRIYWYHLDHPDVLRHPGDHRTLCRDTARGATGSDVALARQVIAKLMHAGFGTWLENAWENTGDTVDRFNNYSFLVNYVNMEVVFDRNRMRLSIAILFLDGYPAQFAAEHPQDDFAETMQRMEGMLQQVAALTSRASQLLIQAGAQLNEMREYLRDLQQGTSDNPNGSGFSASSDSEDTLVFGSDTEGSNNEGSESSYNSSNSSDSSD